ncbi:G-protein coupled receptor Mth2-like isoform X2 [Harmonia axyridis]|uniref:G-protein coupled receptor Mth2-like isoform X2 n=1 Tax=Harmonia axyridis TaxID=115357 RepID=UPI001E2772F3|nr:G-protein coupled receptor Mth2-like isoform X2 [Harmonia axyridis]
MISSTLSLLLISVSIFITRGNSQPKCCGVQEYIVENSGNFSCMKPKSTRRTVNETFTERDFLKKNTSGSCLESSYKKNVILLEVNNGIIKKQKDYGTLFFPKCCPLNHSYNRKTHGCHKDANFLELLKADSFVYISLKNCKIISDEVFESIDDVEMKDLQLSFLKKNRTLMEGSYCLDSTLDRKFVVRICEDKYEGMAVCNKIRCIRKCCVDGKSLVEDVCKFTFKGIDLHFTDTIDGPDDPFAVITGFADEMMRQKSTSHFSLDKFGTFSLENGSSVTKYNVTNRSYCIEHVLNNNELEINGFHLYTSKVEENEVETFHSRWMKLVSCIFLSLTIVIYLILPTMRNLFGKILLNYCVSTLILFACLTIVQFFFGHNSPVMCKIVGFISILSCMWSFTWLNIMCFDIWYSFGTPRTMFGPLRNEGKRLLRYSYYGWGFPIIWVLIIGICSATTVMPEGMHPYIGEKKCLLENSNTRIFIFIIFICKKKVYYDVCIKLRIMKARKVSVTSNISTNVSLYTFEAEKSTK